MNMKWPSLFRRREKDAEPVPHELKSVPLPELLPVHHQGPQWRDWSTDHAIHEGFQASTWVFVGVELRRKAVESVPWHAERFENGEWVRDESGALQALMNQPNPEMTWRQIVGRSVQWLDLGGNAYWLKTRAGRNAFPVELWPGIPDAMKAIPGRERLIQAYRWERYGRARDIPAEDVVHFAYPNPGNLYYGQSLIRSAGMAVDIDTESQRYQKVSLQNRGVPDGVFTLRGDNITRPQWEQARDQVREQYQTKDAYRAPWVVGHAEWQQMSLNPVELDYLNTRKQGRVEILAALGVPPPMAGVYDDATLANIETARKIFWRDTIVPLLRALRDQLNQAIAAEFGPAVRIVYDVSHVDALRESWDDKVDTADRFWRMGVPFAEINERLELGFDLDKIPTAHTAYIPAGLIPVIQGTPEAGGVPDAPEEPSAPQEPSADLNGAQVDAILRLVEAVAMRQLPRQSAVAIIVASFPIDEEAAEEIVGEVGRSFFVDTQEPDEARGRLPDSVKAALEKHRRKTITDLAHIAYGGA